MSDQLENKVNEAKLFVGNLPFSINEDQLREVFSEFGQIKEVNLIPDKTRPNAHKGFGFVEFENQEDAQKAVETLHESELEGRNIIVNVAKPLVPRERRDGGFRGGDRGGDRRGGDRRGFGGGSRNNDRRGFGGSSRY
jgi:nucleolin